MTIGVKYCAGVFDGSGYSEFARVFISALSKFSRDISLTVQPISFEQARPDIGKHGDVIKPLVNKDIPYQVKLINAIPDALPSLAESGKINICSTMFETNRIPKSWVDHLNKLADAVFVPCSWNKEVFATSGVTKPIYVVPPGVNPEDYKDMGKPATKQLDTQPGDVVFYSIFQWTARKNPEGLIKSYIAAFDGVEDVVLVLKTYGSDHSPVQQQRIKEFIQHIKRNMTTKKPPKILFLGGLLSNDQINTLHKECDVYVIPHKAEGFSMPCMKAMAYGKPVIATGFSGNTDFMNETNSFLLPYQMTVVSDMPWIPYYESDMEWAEPNLVVLKEYMKRSYLQIKASREHGDKDCEIYNRAAKGQSDIFEKFSWKNSTEKFENAVKEVVHG